jgi:transposase-like protein
MPSAQQPGRRPDPATRRRWQRRLQRFRNSGLSVTDFCTREQVSPASFYAWRRRLRDGHAPAPSDAPCLVPVRVVAAPAGAPLELLLPSGCVLRLSPDCDLAWLRQVLSLLGAAPC